MIDRKFRKCLITGIAGSGGSYLAEHILSRDKNIKIFGIYRSAGNKNLLKSKRIKLFKGDLCNFYRTQKIIKKIEKESMKTSLESYRKWAIIIYGCFQTQASMQIMVKNFF